MDRNVEYILEVARCGGITRAAENLFITPSALSKYVITLEEQDTSSKAGPRKGKAGYCGDRAYHRCHAV